MRPERRTLAWLAAATVFQGYDNFVLGLALPAIRADLGMTIRQAGLAGSVIFAGSFASFLLLLAADRWSRRAVMVLTVGGFTTATVLTAISTGVVDFVAYQFVARIFIGAEIVLASFIVVETLPLRRRGRGVAVLSASETAGQALAGVGFLLIVLASVSWRTLYLAGGLAFLLLLAASVLPGGVSTARKVPLSDVSRRWIVGASLLGFLFAIFPGAVGMFASTIVLEEWGWNLRTLNPAYLALFAVAATGFFAAGRMMDGWGRKPTAVLFFAGTAAAAFLGFNAATDPGRAFGLAVTLFFLLGSSATLLALTTEPFPERVRGRVAAIVRTATVAGTAVAPGLVALLLTSTAGVASAVAVTGLGLLAAVVVVVVFLPETVSAANR